MVPDTVPDPAPQAVASQRMEAKPLIIKRIDAIPIAIPLKKPINMAGVRIEVSYDLLVRAEASNGLVGWGEASVAPTMTGDMLPGMLAAVNEHLAPLIVGKDALKRAELAHLCAHALHHNGGPKCAVDAAIADLAGRYLNVSLSDLYGGALRDSMAAMYLLGNPKSKTTLPRPGKKSRKATNFSNSRSVSRIRSTRPMPPCKSARLLAAMSCCVRMPTWAWISATRAFLSSGRAKPTCCFWNSRCATMTTTAWRRSRASHPYR
jgi:hypothetical protein